MQFLTLIALFGVEGHPLDVVLRQHGMLHGAYLDMDDAVFHCPDRDMLLHGGVGRAGDDLAHRLAAADDGNARVLDLGNDVTAMLANVKLLHHDAQIKDVGAYFAVSDAVKELGAWSPDMRVSSRGYMLGYQSLDCASVKGAYRFLAKVGDGLMKMQIVRLDFGGGRTGGV